jgi:hypothetical protein
MRLTYNAELRVDHPEQIEELVRLAANAEIGLTLLEKTEAAPEAESEPHFTLDRDRAARELDRGDGAITVVNAYSDADEYHGLIDAAQGEGIIARPDPRSQIYIYPMSLSEPDPMVAVDGGQGPTRLAFASTPSEREGETPVAFTLRFLEEVVSEANSLLAR